MPEDHDTLLEIVNRSGFLFQLRVAHEIENTRSKHEWKVLTQEYRWKDLESGKEGFIDLVLVGTRHSNRMVIECKRVINGNWIFLVPEVDSAEQSLARVLWIQSEMKYGWDEFTVYPRSLKSMFCIVRGQGEKDTPMLERLAGTLLRSTESLAFAETYSNSRERGKAKVYYPVIVTNATLHVCKYDTNDIDLMLGKLDPEKANFETVPLIRFQKGLSTMMSPNQQSSGITIASEVYERTVFVMNVSYMIDLLGKWDINRAHAELPLPWEVGDSGWSVY